MTFTENRPSAEIVPFPVAARRSAVEASRRAARPRLPDFVVYAAGDAPYHEAAIREDAESRQRGH
ncbi:DUF2735 domain-containing protein [Jiella sonneratiae]|uniref:DUF2735 domain-containing protein n=1 Tax=Jiella sonneratiae TaxID=2816856 RepID=A0ABS3J6N1_9HYPH|nr:DUF2735 domain-containing protein [Jiella sonneratiae]MBO0905328.1 DUF2735 domain-containing protein [Jiella sonneratiae]